MIRYLLLIALPLAAGCDVEVKNPANENSDHVAIGADDKGEVAFDLPFARGSLKLPEGAMDESDVNMDGVRLMPGSKVTGFSVLADKPNEAAVKISFTAPAEPADVSAYFKEAFADKGVDAKVAGDTITATTKDGADIRIDLASGNPGSIGKIAIVDRN